jgi:hypothetical protein
LLKFCWFDSFEWPCVCVLSLEWRRSPSLNQSGGRRQMQRKNTRRAAGGFRVWRSQSSFLFVCFFPVSVEIDRRVKTMDNCVVNSKVEGRSVGWSRTHNLTGWIHQRWPVGSCFDRPHPRPIKWFNWSRSQKHDWTRKATLDWLKNRGCIAYRI